MTTALLCITFYILGASSFGVLALLMIAHRRPPPPSITKNARKPVDVMHRVFDKIDAMPDDEFARKLSEHSNGAMVHAFEPHRRKNRDALPSTLREPPPMPVCKPARDAEVGGIDYQWINLTGEER